MRVGPGPTLARAASITRHAQGLVDRVVDILGTPVAQGLQEVVAILGAVLICSIFLSLAIIEYPLAMIEYAFMCYYSYRHPSCYPHPLGYV